MALAAEVITATTAMLPKIPDASLLEPKNLQRNLQESGRSNRMDTRRMDTKKMDT